jgi:hypothetical protein
MTPFQILSFGLGLLALVVGFISLQFPTTVQQFMKNLPRNEWLGKILFLFNLVWALWLLSQMQLGEWEYLRFIRLLPTKTLAYVLSPVIYIFVITYLNKYLGARSLGLFLILAAKPLTWICFLSKTPWSVVISALAYIWLVLGMCFVAVPHWMRDLISFCTANPNRWRWACLFRMVLGVFLIFVGFVGK